MEMNEQKEKDSDQHDITRGHFGGTSVAPNSEQVPRHDIIIYINEVNVVVAGIGNVIRGNVGGENGCGLDVRSNEILACIMRPDPMIFPNVLQRTGPCVGRAYTLIVTKTRQLTDAGQTQKFVLFTDKLTASTQQKKYKDLYVLVLIQKAIFHIYAKKFEVALSELMLAKELSETCLNRNILLGRCLIYEAYIKLYQGKFEEALDYVESAKCLLCNLISGEEKAMICYLTGYVYMKMAGAEDRPSEQLEVKAIEYFELHNRHANEDTEREIAIKEMQYGIFKQATVYLRTYSTNGYTFGTSEERIDKAKELLDFFEMNQWQDATPASKIHFTTLQADYLYRKGCLKRALYILKSSGVKLATEVGHRPMIEMVKDRIALMEGLITDMKK